ncbi:hypothetical protein FPZ43_03500 [Mucilaginibacter pallidiroseus]|uniref:DUF2938 domain-containing protein n=1 Tax=Mucilaginibacter pallidiroseus TaxID=2599295 RepID=A0A563UJN0_9SPHI|nr:hypothetical protein [Mucilaginibacter pallidiroseus]TWR31551.1 hypothetical protein FPZ43_03500 [Mucilaginibacter pallidiroseus]
MNRLGRIAATDFMGTNIMTLSSELMSLLAGENFSEPDHLETMISRLAPALSKHSKKIAAWGAHYAMGFIFAAIYVELWETGKIKRNIRNGLVLGVISGVAGFLIWKGTFKAHPLPPWLNYTHYYWQRIPAHVVFSLAATITHRLLYSDKKHSGTL